jgi:hypothetical protein
VRGPVHRDLGSRHRERRGSAGSLGVIAGGALTSGPGWEWVFLINVPVGIVFAALVASLIPASERAPGRSLDVGGAITVTAR